MTKKTKYGQELDLNQRLGLRSLLPENHIKTLVAETKLEAYEIEDWFLNKSNNELILESVVNLAISSQK